MERYSDEKIETVNPYIFEDIRRTHFYQGDSLRLLKDTSYNGTLYGYMYDYLHSADLGKSKCLLQPPIDMVWLQCDLAGCPEDLIETQEDMYYYAVMALYSTYIAKKVEVRDE